MGTNQTTLKWFIFFCDWWAEALRHAKDHQEPEGIPEGDHEAVPGRTDAGGRRRGRHAGQPEPGGASPWPLELRGTALLTETLR